MQEKFKVRPQSFNKETLDSLYEDILIDGYLLETRVVEVAKRIREHIQNEGLKVEFEAERVAHYASNLSELHVLGQMIQVMGLTTYQDRIMNNMIDRLFPPVNPQHRPVQQTVEKKPE